MALLEGTVPLPFPVAAATAETDGTTEIKLVRVGMREEDGTVDDLEMKLVEAEVEWAVFDIFGWGREAAEQRSSSSSSSNGGSSGCRCRCRCSRNGTDRNGRFEFFAVEPNVTVAVGSECVSSYSSSITSKQKVLLI